MSDIITTEPGLEIPSGRQLLALDEHINRKTMNSCSQGLEMLRDTRGYNIDWNLLDVEIRDISSGDGRPKFRATGWFQSTCGNHHFMFMQASAYAATLLDNEINTGSFKAHAIIRWNTREIREIEDNGI